MSHSYNVEEVGTKECEVSAMCEICLCGTGQAEINFDGKLLYELEWICFAKLDYMPGLGKYIMLQCTGRLDNTLCLY